ncbi:MAG: hypothetical protein FWH18_11060, partial [Marinilabiliaceae bacterium]|nr:hypothetical protein [Marinilabiliaceae bacterium]
MKYKKIREESLKNKVAKEYFPDFDCSDILKDIDFAVKNPTSINLQAVDFEDFYHLLGETKTDSDDIVAMLTQLVLTMGKART